MENNISYSSWEKFIKKVSILNISAPNTRADTFVKEILLKLNSHTKTHTPIVGDFNTS